MKHKVSWAYYGRWTDEEEAILKNTLKAVERNIIHKSGITNYYNDPTQLLKSLFNSGI